MLAQRVTSMRDGIDHRLGTPEEPHPSITEKVLRILWNRLRMEGEAGLREMAERIFSWQDRWHLFKPLYVDEDGHDKGPMFTRPPRRKDRSVPPPYRDLRYSAEVLVHYQKLRAAILKGGYEAFKREWIELMGPLPDERAEEREGDGHGR
jgi:hypothetical protein